MSKSDCLILLGPPNSGKTTLFNWITGYKRQIVNYPGSTADLAKGKVRYAPQKAGETVIDTPGFYSFFSSSQEANITKKVLKDSLHNKTLKAVILVLDSTRLKRQLPLFFQLKSKGLPIILALTMSDIQKKESELNINQLSQILKVPVCPIEGLLGGGVQELLKKTHTHFKDPPVLDHPLSFSPWSESKQSACLNKAHKIVEQVLVKKDKKTIGHKTKILDSFLLHPVFGFAFLSLILFAFFSSIFWLAQPVMNLVDQGVGWGVDTLLKTGPPGMVMDFLANGVLTGFGSFLIFIPQIFILFLGLYLLEDSGYMARAVSLLDGPFSRIGLSGRALFPFLSGFACAIPAILSARTISSQRERWITIFVLPFMTCSARLPVYTLLLGFLFYGDSSWKPGLWMSLLYFLSLFLGVAGAGLLNLFIKKDQKSSFFMELPLYRRPVLKSVLSVSWSRTRHFILKAGPVIFIFSLLMWIATNYPRVDRDGEGSSVTKMEQSYAGQFGQWIEPVFAKMGGDWRVGVSLLSAFVAREVFVSVLAVTLKNTKDQSQREKSEFLEHPVAFTENSDTDKAGLVRVMKQTARSDGQALFSFASILALLMFFVFSLQCLSTTAVVFKETQSWKWAGAQLVSFNVLAYLLAVLTYSLFRS